MITDLRKTWEIGRKVGVRWGIDERPGVGKINEDVAGHYITYEDLDAPYGYKIWAEFVSVDAPKLGSGKCPIQETGWYRTAKVPITQDESRNMDDLKAFYNYGEKMKVRLVNENQPDQVVIVKSPEEGYVTEVYSKTPNYASGNRNWNWNGPTTRDTSGVDTADYSLEDVLG
jgi:hypothetical protein